MPAEQYALADGELANAVEAMMMGEENECHVPARDDLLEFIMKKLAISKNFSHRRAFIWFCKHLVSIIPF